MNNFQWIPFFTFIDYNDPVVPNLSDYVKPQFWTYQRFLNETKPVTVFYDAIPCSEVFKDVTDESLLKELEPMWEETEWWCPNLPAITLNNNILPFTSVKVV